MWPPLAEKNEIEWPLALATSKDCLELTVSKALTKSWVCVRSVKMRQSQNGNRIRHKKPGTVAHAFKDTNMQLKSVPNAAEGYLMSAALIVETFTGHVIASRRNGSPSSWFSITSSNVVSLRFI